MVQKGKKIGYIRVSTVTQNIARQMAEMEKEKVDKLFTDQASGKDTSRPAFQEMLDYLREDDMLYISSLDRLGRNYEDIKKTVDLLHKKKVQITIFDAPFLNFDTGNPNLDKAMYDMFLSLLSYIAQNEREKMLERQRAGIEQAKTRGAYKGKQARYHSQAQGADGLVYKQVTQMLEQGEPISQIARVCGITRPTVYRIRKEL